MAILATTSAAMVTRSFTAGRDKLILYYSETSYIF